MRREWARGLIGQAGMGLCFLSRRVMAGGPVNCQHRGESRWVCKAQTRGIANNQSYRKQGRTPRNNTRGSLTLSSEDEDTQIAIKAWVSRPTRSRVSLSVGHMICRQNQPNRQSLPHCVRELGRK